MHRSGLAQYDGAVSDRQWRRAGRAFAWAYGGLAIVGGILAAVVSSGIPPTEPDLAHHYAYIRQIWPELYVSFLLLMAAFLALVPIGITLRELFGHSLRSELFYASFLMAGTVGVLWMLVQIGSAQAVSRDAAGANAQTLAAIAASSSVWSGTINWLQRGFLLFASLGTYWVGRAALDQRALPRGLAWLSLALAAFYGLGIVSLVLRDIGVPLPDVVGTLLIAAGSLLATVWAAWLGWVLGREPAS